MTFSCPVEPVSIAAGPVPLIADVSLVVLVVAIGLAVFRLIKGPSLPDRVVALDLIATLLVGLIAVSAVETRDITFLPVAMVVALFNFIGTIGYAWYLQRERPE